MKHDPAVVASVIATLRRGATRAALERDAGPDDGMVLLFALGLSAAARSAIERGDVDAARAYLDAIVTCSCLT